MLSHDLTCLARMAFLSMDGKSVGELQKSLLLIAERIQAGADQAAHLEAAAVGVAAKSVLIDLSDDKVVLFPVAKRPVPREAPDGGAA